MIKLEAVEVEPEGEWLVGQPALQAVEALPFEPWCSFGYQTFFMGPSAAAS